MVKTKIRNQIMKLICDYFSDEKYQLMDCAIIRSKLKLSHNDTIHALRVLEAMGYITFEEKEPPHGFIYITQSGKCYFEIKSDKKLDFIYKSILTPIAVSLLTTLALYLSRSRLIPIVEWVISHLSS